jgi:hypothetical protein
MRFMQVNRALREGFCKYQTQAGQLLPTPLVSLDVRCRSTACCKGRGAVSNLLQRVRCEWYRPWRGDYSAAEVCFSCKCCRGLLQALSDCGLLYGLHSKAVSTMHQTLQQGGGNSHSLRITQDARQNKSCSNQMIENKARTIQPPRIKGRMLDNCGLSVTPTVLSL